MTTMIRKMVWTGSSGLPTVNTSASSASTIVSSCPAMAGPCLKALRSSSGIPAGRFAAALLNPAPAHVRLAACAAYSSADGPLPAAATTTATSTAASCASPPAAASALSSLLPMRRRQQPQPARRRCFGPAPCPQPGPALASPRSTAGSGQVGPPPPRKPHHKGEKQAAGTGVAVAAPPSSGPPPALAVDVVDDDVALEELDEEAGQQLAPYMDAVVKVYCMHTEPNYSLPWQRKRQYSSSSSGFVVRYGGRNWLLTNAHSVDYHTQVKVKRRGDDRKYLARVISVGVDCDIAALEVDDPDFWGGPAAAAGDGAAAGQASFEAAAAAAGDQQGSAPPVLELGPLPRLQDGVAVVGYPIGGDTISVTAGVVSRIEVTDYSHGSTDLLAIQIDAAINGGNSGGPVFNRACQCVGIAFQALVGSDVENVGYVIPTPVVAHFLEDYMRTGTFSGFPALGVQWQRMESDALRRAYGMAPSQKGVLVRAVNPTAAAAAALQPDDVLLAFDGRPISNDGTVPFRTGERIAFSYLVTNKFVGDEARLDVLRGGQRMELTVTLSKPTALVPPHLSNRDPPYLIVGGLVFTTASEPYLQSEYGAEYGSDAPVKLLDRLYHGFPRAADEEVVVLSQVLACDATLGYEEVYNVQLLRFNGTPVTNLRQLAGLVRVALAEEQQRAQAAEAAGAAAAGPGGFLRFDLEYNEVVVVEARDVLRVTPEVMRAHSIPHDMSADLRTALEGSQTQSDQHTQAQSPALQPTPEGWGRA